MAELLKKNVVRFSTDRGRIITAYLPHLMLVQTTEGDYTYWEVFHMDRIFDITEDTYNELTALMSEVECDPAAL